MRHRSLGDGSRRIDGGRVPGAVSTLLVALAAIGTGCNEVGIDGLEGEDFFNQSPPNEVDILWVVDNSGSMAEEQQILASGFRSFADELEASGANFHIGVISTSFDYADPNRGVLIGDPPYLTNDDDYITEFQARTQVGISGSDKEKGLEAAEYALSPSMTLGGPNYGFIRQEAQLLIVVVSDEEDCSDNAALEGQPAAACYRQKDKLVPVSEYVDSYESLKETPDQVLFGAIVGTSKSACENVYESDRYRLVADLTGGLIGDICLSDWSQVLSDLGLISTGTRNTFQLSAGAKEDTIKVWVKDATDTNPDSPGIRYPNDEVNGWTYNPDTWFIKFGSRAVPERGAVIHVTYTVDPGAVTPGEGT